LGHMEFAYKHFGWYQLLSWLISYQQSYVKNNKNKTPKISGSADFIM
jgi:hypothetical protein